MVRKIAEWLGLVAVSLAAVVTVIAGTTVNTMGAVLASAAFTAVLVGLALVFVGTRGAQ